MDAAARSTELVLTMLDGFVVYFANVTRHSCASVSVKSIRATGKHPRMHSCIVAMCACSTMYAHTPPPEEEAPWSKHGSKGTKGSKGPQAPGGSQIPKGPHGPKGSKSTKSL